MQQEPAMGQLPSTHQGQNLGPTPNPSTSYEAQSSKVRRNVSNIILGGSNWFS